MKILYVTTIAGSMVFFPEHFKMLINEGHTVELACNCDNGVPEFCKDMELKIHNIPFSRSPLNKDNIKAYKEIKELIKTCRYDIVHTHTPNASVAVRLASRKQRKKGLKVFYTAHGFHFFKGASIKNWMFYYPVEWLCSWWTDKLITINKEDFARAKKHLHAKITLYIPGVGIDVSGFQNFTSDKFQKRKELGVPEDATLILSIGELNENKNHETVIKAINGMDIYYLIAGEGTKKEELQGLIDNQSMGDKIKLLGYRDDVKELYFAADIFVFPSFREGLSVSLMEAMASGLPCVVSRIRGNTDLIKEFKGGRYFNPGDATEFKNALVSVLNTDTNEMKEYNKEAVKMFEIKRVLSIVRDLYR